MTAPTPLRAPPLPATTSELLSMRKLKRERTINDLVEDVLVRLWENTAFMKYIEAVDDPGSVEGYRWVDDVKAAEMIRDTARKAEIAELAEQRLGTIINAMHVVLRRYGISRKQRKNTIGGEIVPDDNGNGNGNGNGAAPTTAE